MNETDRREWMVAAAAETSLTERQAEAFYRRHIADENRHEAAAAMDTSPSNIDNLERTARGKISKARRLDDLAETAGYREEHSQPARGGADT